MQTTHTDRALRYLLAFWIACGVLMMPVLLRAWWGSDGAGGWGVGGAGMYVGVGPRTAPGGLLGTGGGWVEGRDGCPAIATNYRTLDLNLSSARMRFGKAAKRGFE
jgi:hypothetical protein